MTSKHIQKYFCLLLLLTCNSSFTMRTLWGVWKSHCPPPYEYRKEQMLTFIVATAHPKFSKHSSVQTLPKEIYQYIWDLIKRNYKAEIAEAVQLAKDLKLLA